MSGRNNQSTRIAVLSDNPARRDTLMAMLAAKNYKTISLDPTSRDMSALAMSTCVLVACDLSDTGSGAIVESLLKGVSNNAPIVIIGGGLSPDVMRRVVRMRPADMLADDAREAELIQVLTTVLSTSRQSGASGRVSVFVGARGGVGTTTLALNTAWLLAQENPSGTVCLVDANLHCGACAAILDVEPQWRLTSMMAPDRIDAQVLDAFTSPPKDGIRLLAAPIQIGANPSLLRQVAPRLLELATERYAQVLIDLPAQSADWVEPIVAGADEAFLVTDLSIAGLKLAKSGDAWIQGLRSGEAPRLIINRAPRGVRTAVGPKDVENVFQRQPAIIFEDLDVARDVGELGGPVGARRNDSRLAREMRAAVAAILSTKEPPPRRIGLFNTEGR